MMGSRHTRSIPAFATRGLLLAVLALGCARPAAAGPATVTAAVAPDSIAAPVSTMLSARAAYETAWTLRSQGDFAEAITLADSALAHIGLEIASNPDASTRLELVALRSRIEGLRHLAKSDMRSLPAVEPGNEADDQVLSAKAMDEIEPQLNADVYKWIEFFTGSGRSTFERWLKRSGRYMELFRSVLQKEGLPPDLVHLVFVESGFNVNARSVSAAVGPWQFLRSSGRLFGLTVNQWVDERKDPEKSTVAAARYLKHLYSIFGDWPLALASYNAGEGTVLRAIKRQGTTNYWDLKLPRQTEEYVPQFMAVLAISRDPQKYGFDSVELDEPMQFDEIAFKGPVDLRVIAKLCECSYEELRALNPAVLKHAATGTNGVTVLRVPAGKSVVLMDKLTTGVPLPAVNLTLQHRVRRGESLQNIADQYHVSAQRLARANGIGKKHPLKSGMVLTVPSSLFDAPELLDERDPRASTAYVPERTIRPPAQIDAESSAEGRLTHTVRKGETLSSIAAKYDVSTADIRRWNRLTTNSVRRGTRLKIRTGIDADTAQLAASADSVTIAKLTPPTSRKKSRSSSSASATAVNGVIVVRAGDTLSGLAKRHGVSVGALKEANGLGNSSIRAGQRLRLPT